MKIENSYYCITFTTQGGEMTSMVDKRKNVQILYQGNEGWSGKNPTLFPLVGNTYTKDYMIDGKTYAMKNHGLIRYQNLRVKNQKETEITFECSADEHTLAQYPFTFDYQITYTLVDDCLHIEYRITNRDSQVMPFQFGLHPGFRFFDGDELSDYQVVFEKQQQAKQIVYDASLQSLPKYEDVTLKALPLALALFQKYSTLLYDEVQQNYVLLKGKNTAIEVGMKGFPYLAIWNDQQSHFVCIEPWMSIPDFYEVNVPFQERKGTMMLEPDQSTTFQYYIKVR